MKKDVLRAALMYLARSRYVGLPARLGLRIQDMFWLRYPHLMTRIDNFLIIGGASTVIQAALLMILTRQMRFIAAVVLGAIIATVPNYILSKKIVWKDRVLDIAFKWNAILFPVFLVTKFSIPLKIAGMALLHAQGVPVIASLLCTEAAGAGLSFLFLDKIAFGSMTRVISRISKRKA